MNLYLYATATPLLRTDPDGRRVEFRDFPPAEQRDAEAAIQRIKDQLEATPCCVKEGRAPKIRELLDDPKRVVILKFKRDAKNCGLTPFSSMIGVNNTIRISPRAWDCCRGGQPAGVPSLAAVILHELHHYRFKTPEGSPRAAQNACFGCQP